jgi:plastocyanin
MRPLAVMVVLALGAMSIVGCGSNSGAPTPVSVASAHAMTHPLIVPNTHGSSPDSWYEPDPIRVRVGQSITWTNQDTDPHDVTADDGTFYSGPIGDGGSFRWTPTRPGTYRYFCTIHPEMHGEIIVGA